MFDKERELVIFIQLFLKLFRTSVSPIKLAKIVQKFSLKVCLICQKIFGKLQKFDESLILIEITYRFFAFDNLI
jgi:hypothetical protein